MDQQSNNIGRCELCGTIDHHLIDGACNHCNTKYELSSGEYACNDNYVQRLVIKDDATLHAKAMRETFSVEVAA